MTPEQRQNIIEDFIQYCKDRLDIDQLPIIQYTNDREWATEKKSFGQYNPNNRSLEVYTGNRNLADTLRTLVHELVHHKQNEDGLLRMDSGKTGSKIENQANSFAGIIMREYGNKNDLIYEGFLPTLRQIYEVESNSGIQIYCDMDGVLCDFDARFEHFYNMSPSEYRKQYRPEKANEYLTKAVDEVGITYWSKMQWMPGGQELWSIIGKYNPIILTSPGKFDYAEEGKLEWIQNNLSPQPKEVIFAESGNKHLKMVTDPKKSILIDDYWTNLAPWKALGGIAIMHKDINKTKDILSKFRLTENKNNLPNKIYHFTIPKYFVNMVKTNTIKADPKFKQISFTTDPNLWAFREFTNEDQEVGIRLTFNTKDLPPLTPFKYSGAPGENYEYEQEYTTNVGDLRPSSIFNLVKDITADIYWKEYLQKNLPETIFNKINFI